MSTTAGFLFRARRNPHQHAGISFLTGLQGVRKKPENHPTPKQRRSGPPAFGAFAACDPTAKRSVF